MSQKNRVLKIILPVIILLIGVLIMIALVRSRSEPRKEVKNSPGVLVETMRVEKKNREIIITGTGSVEAAQEVSLIPQVSGRITYIAPHLAVGGHFKKDEILFKIEDVDYVLVLEQAKASRAKAEVDLATMKSNARIARAEWDKLNLDDQEEPNPLVLYQPQLANAGAALASAVASVDQAQLALERTIIRAPFNARIKSENIDIGQYVNAGSGAAVLSGTDRVEIKVPLPPQDLRWLDIPLHGKELNGPDATVIVNIGGDEFQWRGQVLRSTGEVDTKSRMMQIIIGISDPYLLRDKKGTDRPALAIGTFVEVKIKGRKLRDVFVIPRIAFRDNSTVWVMSSENTLLIKKAVPLKIENIEVIISGGLKDGDMLILTNITGAADGMKLRKTNQ